MPVRQPRPSFRYDNAMRTERHWLTVANALSAVRLVAAPACAWAVFASQWPVAVGLFYLAVATDLLDGPVARRRGEVSVLGGLVDHATDAFFCTCVLGALAVRDLTPAVLPVLVAAAFLQYSLDSKALAGKALRTSRLGRYNGISYFVLAGIPITRNALGWTWPVDGVVLGLGWLLVATTVVSMLDRLRAAWPSMRTGPPKRG